MTHLASTNNAEYWLKKALEIASDARFVTQKMGCVVVKGGVMVSAAHNLGVAKNVGIGITSKHAEKRALRPFATDYTGAVIYVARVGKSMSRPCNSCMELIREAGIKKIVYFDWDGNVCMERV